MADSSSSNHAMDTESSSSRRDVDAQFDDSSQPTNTEDIPMSFPQRLMEILSNDEISEIISWLPHGKGFIIYKKKKFGAEVLPLYFKQSKFTSFTRKLNRWGFTRITRGPETGAYYHKFFLRDEPRLCLQMSCQNVRLHQEQMAVEQQQQHQRAMLGFAPLGGAYAAAAAQSAPVLSNAHLHLQLQQLQLEQFQKQQQQQIQANELVRRAMATQATASATQAQLAAAMSGSEASGLGDAMAVQQAPNSLYMQLLAQSKASVLPPPSIMMALQSRPTPPFVPSSAPTPPGNDFVDGGESMSEHRVRRASAA